MAQSALTHDQLWSSIVYITVDRFGQSKYTNKGVH